MELRADLVPAEEENGQEARLEEEGEDALGGQGAAEDVADVARVGGPIRAELKFHDDAGGNADGEGEREHLRPEAGHLVIELLAGGDPQAFHDDKHEAKPDTQRRVDVMERDGERKLDAGEKEHVHENHASGGGMSEHRLVWRTFIVSWP